MKCKGCEAYGDYGCRAGFTSIIINGELGCEDADRALDAFHFNQAIDRTVTSVQTNADRIRAMTDEELAEFINDTEYGFIDRPGMCDVCAQHRIQNCYQCWIDWLRQEAEPCEPQS